MRGSDLKLAVLCGKGARGEFGDFGGPEPVYTRKDRLHRHPVFRVARARATARKPKHRLANVETPTPTRYGKALKRMTSVFIAQEFLEKFVKVQTCTEGMTGQG